jgi:formiminotetrahydrofolate cyclodeaminase
VSCEQQRESSGEVRDFLISLAEPGPRPGGGAAAAYGASVGLALLEKIAGLEAKRPENIGQTKAFWEMLLARLKSVSERLAQLREEDGRVYAMLTESRKAYGTASDGYSSALRHATQVPLEIMKEVPRALACAEEIGARCKRHLLSDLLAACELLAGGSRSASCIVEANMRLFADKSVQTHFRRELNRIQEEVFHLLEQIRALGLSRLDASSGSGTEPMP